ncbi:MAG: alpha/beta fold hydrolase [Acidobacteriota bacterium]
MIQDMKKLFGSLILIFALIAHSSKAFAQQPAASDELTEIAKQLVASLVKEDFASVVKNFDDTMKRVSPEDKLRETWKAVIGQVGAFKNQYGVRKEKAAEFDAVVVSCEFALFAVDVKVVFNGQKQISGLFFLPASTPPPAKPASAFKKPDYANLDSFIEKEVTVGAGEWALSATLTLPKGEGKFVAIVLVHGSGPHDRDETIFQNKPFRDLAWGLASQGIAVLRYEKRTKAHAAKLVAIAESVTVKEEAVDDALAAVALLKTNEKIDAKKIFVLGHSLGGMLLPRIAKGDASIAGLISLAGLTRPLEDTILEQMTYIASLEGNVSPQAQQQLEIVKAQVAKVKDATLKPGDKGLLLGVPGSYWLDLRGYNPPEEAKNLKQPMLILQGEKDYQVTLKDFENWKAALGARKDVEFKSYAKLYHLFIETEEKAAPSNYAKEGNIAKYVIDDIVAWIKRQK